MLSNKLAFIFTLFFVSSVSAALTPRQQAESWVRKQYPKSTGKAGLQGVSRQVAHLSGTTIFSLSQAGSTRPGWKVWVHGEQTGRVVTGAGPRGLIESLAVPLSKVSIKSNDTKTAKELSVALMNLASSDSPLVECQSLANLINCKLAFSRGFWKNKTETLVIDTNKGQVRLK